MERSMKCLSHSSQTICVSQETHKNIWGPDTEHMVPFCPKPDHAQKRYLKSKMHSFSRAHYKEKMRKMGHLKRLAIPKKSRREQTWNIPISMVHTGYMALNVNGTQVQEVTKGVDCAAEVKPLTLHQNSSNITCAEHGVFRLEIQ